MTVGCAVVALGALIGIAAPAGAVAPAGKNYAITLMLIDPETGELDAAPGCLSFSGNEVCTEFDDCGPWEFVGLNRGRNTWVAALSFEDDETGELVDVAIFGQTERRGPKSAISATIIGTVGDRILNGGLGGTQISLSRCLVFGLSDD